jgi:lipoate-protein ligase B
MTKSQIPSCGISVIDMGVIGYEKCYALQRELVARRRLGLAGDSLIIAEHRPVFTIGRSGSIENLLADRSELRQRGIEVLCTDRGGDITFHGPGQIVAYPIIDLSRRKRDLHLYMRDLERSAIDFLKGYSLDAERRPGKTGVWACGAKVAFIGIGASGWITYHGMSVNINTDLEYFSMIRPCGMDGLRVLSLKDILGRPLDMDEVKRRLSDSIARVLNPPSRNSPPVRVGMDSEGNSASADFSRSERTDSTGVSPWSFNLSSCAKQIENSGIASENYSYGEYCCEAKPAIPLELRSRIIQTAEEHAEISAVA